MRRAKLEGRRIGRAPLNVDRAAIVRDRLAGLSRTKVAKKHRVSRAAWKMKGLRWFALSLALLQLWLLAAANFIAGMSLTGTWL